MGRHPRPRVVVGLALVVVELEVEAADGERHRLAIRLGRPDGVVREERCLVVAQRQPMAGRDAAELSPVDDLVVAVGLDVALEPRRDVLVPDHRGRCMVASFGVGHHGAAPTHMVDVTMGVDEGVDPVGRPRAERLDDRGPAHRTARVERHEAVVGPEHDHVAERLDQGDVVVDLGQFVADPVDRLLGRARVDDAARQLDRIGGADLIAVARRGMRAHARTVRLTRWGSRTRRGGFASAHPADVAG